MVSIPPLASTINLDPLLLGGGIVLLWFPRHWMRRVVALSKGRRRSTGSSPISDAWTGREPGDPKIYPRVEFTKARNYIDLARTVLGGLLIWGGLGVTPALAAVTGATRNENLQVLAAKVMIIVVAVLIQAVRYERHRLSFYPPIFYLAGLSLGMCGYRTAAFAFLLMWAINPGLANAQVFLTVYALALYVFGALFNGFASVPVAALAIMTFIPVLMSLLTNRPLQIFTRRGARTG